MIYESHGSRTYRVIQGKERERILEHNNVRWRLADGRGGKCLKDGCKDIGGIFRICCLAVFPEILFILAKGEANPETSTTI
jgi:hypothetical protein